MKVSAPNSKWVLIANPAAGGGDAGRAARAATSALSRAGRPVELLFSRERGHGTALARQAVIEGAAVVVACGGDGTIAEMLPALSATGVSLGVLPFGTANDFARGLGIPLRLDRAVANLVKGRPKAVDLGWAGDRLFCTVAAFGFDAEVSQAMNEGRVPISGTSGYVYASLRHLSVFQPPTVRLTGEFGHIEGPVLLVATGNTRSYGGGMKIVPAAAPFDGKLDICIVSPVSRWTVMAVLPRVLFGRHVNHPAVRMVRSSWLQIDTPEPHAIQADGEDLTRTPARIEVRPGALDVILATDAA